MPLHFSIIRQDLLDAMGAMQNVSTKKGVLAILANVLIQTQQDKVVFTATDLETGIKISVPAEVSEQGSLTIPAKKLFEVARESSSSGITFRENENCWVEIVAGSSTYNLSGIQSEEYPEFPEYNEEAMVELDGSIFVNLVDKTGFSIAMEKENVYTLTAARLLLEDSKGKLSFRMITSDGHRLSLISMDVDEAVKNLKFNDITLIPRRGIQEMKRFCEDREKIKFGLEKKQAVLKDEESLLIIRLMEGQFPDHHPILDAISRKNGFQIDRLTFLDSLKRINLFTDEIFHTICLEISTDRLVLTSQNADFGRAKDEIDIIYNGEAMTLGFNCRYFIDALQVMSGPVVNIFITSHEAPCLLTCEEDPGYLAIVMPMKLSE